VGSVIDPHGGEWAALEQLGGLRDARVLEVGCGNGRLTRRYAPDARSVLAIDPDAAEIAAAQALLPARLARRVTFRVGGIESLEGPPEAFDAVFLSHSL
jgi:2-polyprenyl-3-methyl-5-hydroxy-6-metoxy-1,4-benzoquinol methylase